MTYPVISPLPTPPSRQDPATFSDRADVFLGSFPTLQTEINASGTYFEGQNSVATDAAAAALVSKNAAAASATAAGTSETNASTSETNAATSATGAETSLASFNVNYLGEKTADPTLDNSGNALVTGALYFNTTANVMKVYNGTAWVAAYASLNDALLSTNNLSDLTSVTVGRTNLGLGTTDTPTFASTTVTSFEVSGSVTEGVFALTGTTPAIGPDNGTIQTWTLTGASTPTFAAGWSSGESLTLLITAGANSISWPTMEWGGAVAPVLSSTAVSGVVILKVGAVYYGSPVGDFA